MSDYLCTITHVYFLKVAQTPTPEGTYMMYLAIL